MGTLVSVLVTLTRSHDSRVRSRLSGSPTRDNENECDHSFNTYTHAFTDAIGSEETEIDANLLLRVAVSLSVTTTAPVM